MGFKCLGSQRPVGPPARKWTGRTSPQLAAIGLLSVLCMFGMASHSHAGSHSNTVKKSAKNPTPASSSAATGSFNAEARLIAIYKLIGQARTREALGLAEQLTRDQPNFALAQLVYGDLLQAQTRQIKVMGDVPEATVRGAPGVLGELREESLLRIKALRERPPAGSVPAQFVHLSARNRHAIAIDASRSRLYLYENSAAGLQLVADYYISVGKLGTEKTAEGDLRTPLGVYFITSTLDKKSLKDFYGAGALPINYPNPYDLRRGKTGGGIWLHGTPTGQFARPPKATDGCVVLANPDLQRILATVQTRSTPVVIANSLQWATPAQAALDHSAFDARFAQWRAAKGAANLPGTLAFYMDDFNSYGKTLRDWTALLQTELAKPHSRPSELKDLSVIHWQDGAQSATMVVTFSEIAAGSRSGLTKRQYWMRSATTQNQWKIFFEGTVG